MNVAEREVRKALFRHTEYCQAQLDRAQKENTRWNGFYSQQYETIKECQSKGLDYMQFDTLRRKARADVEFWDKEFEKAVHNFYGSFASEGEATYFMLICCNE